MTKYEKNKVYPTRNGDKAIIYDLNYQNVEIGKPRMLGKVIQKTCSDVARTWDESGRINPDVVHDHDIMIGYSSFHNVYCDYLGNPHKSREEADIQKGAHRIGVVEISVWEGEITTVVHK